MKNEASISLWEKDCPDICRFCAYAKRFSTTSDVYCEKKKNFLSEEETCKKFKYDILKKELRRKKAQIKKYDKEDFEI